jgi:hypothetical protein
LSMPPSSQWMTRSAGRIVSPMVRRCWSASASESCWSKTVRPWEQRHSPSCCSIARRNQAIGRASPTAVRRTTGPKPLLRARKSSAPRFGCASPRVTGRRDCPVLAVEHPFARIKGAGRTARMEVTRIVRISNNREGSPTSRLEPLLRRRTAPYVPSEWVYSSATPTLAAQTSAANGHVPASTITTHCVISPAVTAVGPLSYSPGSPRASRRRRPSDGSDRTT